jgi:hypothetical protein
MSPVGQSKGKFRFGIAIESDYFQKGAAKKMPMSLSHFNFLIFHDDFKWKGSYFGS